MTSRITLIPAAGLLIASLLAVGPALADVTIVDEDFESYATNNDLYAVWQPRDGTGFFDPIFPDDGILEDGSVVPENVNAYPADGLGGLQGVDHVGSSVLQYLPALGSDGSGAAIVPTAEQSIVLSGDIFDTAAAGNKRLTIGLRNRTTTENIVELGFWNASDPDVGYSYRLVIFQSGDPATTGSWVPILLDSSLDREDDADDIVTPADIGEGWHRWTATITPTDVTIEFDLFRNGLDDATGSPGVDFTETVPAVATANGFDSLRIGGPSGVSSPGSGGIGSAVFDNILLALVDVDSGTLEGDYNGDGLVDAADYAVWRNTLGDSVTAGTGADGNGNSVIDAADYDAWRANYGASAAAAAAPVPEPMSVVLLALVGLLRRQPVTRAQRR